MSYSTIEKTKFGNCSQCTATDTNVVKRGKELFCLNCARDNKNKEQITKANVRQRVRSLINYERAEGILDSIGELKLDLDRVISRYIRLRDMEKDGKVTCYTCGARKDWKKMHCSHFINRIEMNTRFLLDNVRCACYECNVEKRGNLEVFAKKLNAEKPGIVDWLQEQGRQVAEPTRNELKELLFDYQQKLNTVETKLNNMSKIEVVLPKGDMVSVSSNNLNANELANSVNNRQRIAHDYCKLKGWSTDPTELTFDQIIEIGKQKEWIDAGKK